MTPEQELDYEMSSDELAGIGSVRDTVRAAAAREVSDAITESKIRETVRSLLKVKKIRKRK